MNDWDNCKAQTHRQRKRECLRRSTPSPEWTRKGNSATIIIISSFNITPHIVRKIPLFYGGAQNHPDRKWAGSENARVTFSGVDIKGDYCPQAGSSLCVPDTPAPYRDHCVFSTVNFSHWKTISPPPTDFRHHRSRVCINFPYSKCSYTWPLLLAHTAGISPGFLLCQIYAFLVKEKIKKIISTIINYLHTNYVFLLNILSRKLLVSYWKHYFLIYLFNKKNISSYCW